MRILVFQHLDVEHPGVLLEFWREAGHQWTQVELDQGQPIPDLEPFDLLVAMGGPMDVWEEAALPWLVAEKKAIRHWVMALGRPYLGICLGHQLLAAALGGQVGKMAAPEVGLAEVRLTAEGLQDPLLRGLAPELETFQWHGAEVSSLPPGACILAGNAHCATQAIRWGRHAYGLQFHVEITETTVADWGRIPAYAASLEQALGSARARGLGAELQPRLAGFRRVARRLDQNLGAILGVSA